LGLQNAPTNTLPTLINDLALHSVISSVHIIFPQLGKPLFGFVWQQNHSDAKHNQTILQLLFSSSIHGYQIFSYFHLYLVLFGNRTILMPNKTKHFYNFSSPAQLMAIKFSPLFGSVWHQNGSVA
jgi:hypothetical protein